jgi:hypothetical protein
MAKDKEVALPKSIREALTDAYDSELKEIKSFFNVYLRGEPEAIAKKRIEDRFPKAINRIRKGHAVQGKNKKQKKSNNGAQDFRKGGMVLSTTDNRKKK